jgi:hypothetical protein
MTKEQHKQIISAMGADEVEHGRAYRVWLKRQTVHTGRPSGRPSRGYRTYTRTVELRIVADAESSNATVRLNGETWPVEITPSGHWWIIAPALEEIC